MAGVTISLRLPEELLAWVDVYAKACGCTRTDLIAKDLRSIRESGPDDEPITVEPANPSRAQVEAMREREAAAEARIQRAVVATAGAVVPASSLGSDRGLAVGRQGGVNAMIDRARGAGKPGRAGK